MELPLNIPLLEDESCTSTDLPNRIQAFCQEWKEKRKYEWESVRVALEKMRENEGKYQKQAKEEREAAYAQMVQNVERTRAMVRNTVSRASTISAEEFYLALTEKDFLAIQKKMDKIDQRLDDLYKNWHTGYRYAATLEECDEIRKFYKPYLIKYESKYKILYHLLQQPSVLSTQETTSGITPSLTALDDVPSLKQREWVRGEPGEDVPQQHSSISGHLMPTTSRHEDMRPDLSLNVTPEGSLGDLPSAVDHAEKDRMQENQPPRERSQRAPSEIANVGISDMHLKTNPERDTREAPQRVQRTREASREDGLASTRQFFAVVDKRNRNISTGRTLGISSEVCRRDDIDVPGASTSNFNTTPVVPDVELVDTSSPRVIIPNGSPSPPSATATCRPRTWMQQITEGQINEPTRENASLNESNLSTIEVLPEEIPDELGCE